MKVKSVEGMLGSNTFVMTKGETTIIVEAGAELDDVLKELKGAKPSAIILTHEHYDHICYIADYVDAFDCPIYAHEILIDDLKRGSFKNILRSIVLPEHMDNFEPVKSDFKIGEFNIQPIMAPGHSPSSIVFKIDDNLFTGDVLFSFSIGRTDFMEDGPRIMNRTLKNLLQQEFTTAYHGHGGESSYKEQIANIKRFAM